MSSRSGAQSVGRKVWGAKCGEQMIEAQSVGGAKYEGTKYGAQIMGAQSMGRKVWRRKVNTRSA